MGFRWDVVGLGVVSVDDLVYVQRYPEVDSKVRVDGRQRQGGGPAGTALVTASRLGAKCAYLGVLGDDELSRYTLKELEREGVDCSLVEIVDGARPWHSLVIVDQSTGQRTIFYSNDDFHGADPSRLVANLVKRARVLFVDFSVVDAALRAIPIARACGVPVVADVEICDHPRLDRLVDAADHLIIGCELGKEITGEAHPAGMVEKLSHTRACCAVTAGADGVWFSVDDGKVQHCPAYSVPVVDTTGCGDVFHGAYVACLADDADPQRAIVFAAAAAALKATQAGGRAGIPDQIAVRRFLIERGISCP